MAAEQSVLIEAFTGSHDPHASRRGAGLSHGGAPSPAAILAAGRHQIFCCNFAISIDTQYLQVNAQGATFYHQIARCVHVEAAQTPIECILARKRLLLFSYAASF